MDRSLNSNSAQAIKAFFAAVAFMAAALPSFGQKTFDISEYRSQLFSSPKETGPNKTIVPHSPCNSGSISCGQTKFGRVSVDSCNASNIYAVGYFFEGIQGQTATVQAVSFEFAMRLLIGDGRQGQPTTLLGFADVFSIGETATVTLTLPYTGTYVIFAGTRTTTTFGDYSVSVTCSSGTTGSCIPNSTTACLLNNRFRATVRFRSVFDTLAADKNALVKPVTGFGEPNFETAFFYFNSPNNIEMLVKMLDQGNTDSQNRPTIALLFGTATPLRIELIITDTKNGAVRQYQSAFPDMKGTTDFTAFLK